MKTKQLLTAILLFAFSANSFSQIPNSGFEVWTNFGNYYKNPNNWFTTNSTSFGSFYPVTRDTSHYPTTVGNYSMRIESKPSLLPGGEALGAVSTGTGFNLTPDFPITGHPNSLTGYYKYAPQNGDTMLILIALFNNTTLVAAGALETTIAAANWTSFNIPISSYSNANSAKIYIGAYNISGPPPQYVPYGNSVLYVDNLNFDTLIVAGIFENNKADEIALYPNPSTGKFTIGVTGDLEIYNTLGEKIVEQKLTADKTEIDLSNQAKGIYFVKVRCGDNISTQKIVIQ